MEVSHLEFELNEQFQKIEMYKALFEQKDEVRRDMVDRSALQAEIETVPCPFGWKGKNVQDQ